MSQEPDGPKAHPSFASADADIVLSSNDDTHFRVHSQLLRHASG